MRDAVEEGMTPRSRRHKPGPCLPDLTHRTSKWRRKPTSAPRLCSPARTTLARASLYHRHLAPLAQRFGATWARGSRPTSAPGSTGARS